MEIGTGKQLALEVPAARWLARMMPAGREIRSAAAGAQPPDEKKGVMSTEVDASRRWSAIGDHLPCLSLCSNGPRRSRG